MAFRNIMTYWLGLSYVAVVLVVGYWLWKRRGTSVDDIPTPSESSTRTWKLRRTIIIVMVAAAALLVFCLFDTNYNIRFVDGSKIQEIVQQNKTHDMQVWIMQTYPRTMFRTYTDQAPARNFWLELKNIGSKTVKYSAPFDDATLAVIAAKGLECPTYIEGRDFEILGAPGRMLPFITAFLVGVGAVYLLKARRGKVAAQ